MWLSANLCLCVCVFDSVCACACVLALQSVGSPISSNISVILQLCKVPFDQSSCESRYLLELKSSQAFVIITVIIYIHNVAHWILLNPTR